MNLMQRYQRNQSIINQSKNEDLSQSQIRKLYLNSIHKPVLHPLNPPSQSFISSHNSESTSTFKFVSNSSRPIKIENKTPQISNQSIIPNVNTNSKNEEQITQKKNENIDTNQNKFKPKFQICDFEKNKSSIYSKYSNDTLGVKRPNIELPQIERLPSIFRSNHIVNKDDELKFKTILKAKFDLINTKLDFSNLEMDRPAKQIRLSTINEICQIFIGKNANFNKENGEEQLDPNANYEIFKMIFDFLSFIIFRPISEPFEKFTFSDDMINISNMELGQTSLCYNALNIVLSESNLNANSKSKLFDKKFIEKLFHKFYVPDSGERSLLAQFVLDIVNYSNEDYLQFVLKKCYNELVMCTQGPFRLPYVLMPTLSILYNIYCGNVKNRGKKDDDISVYYDDYVHFILPVLRSIYFTSCSQQMTQIIELFVSKGNEEIILTTVFALVKYFPITKSFKSIVFISLISTSLQNLTKSGIKRALSGVCRVATICTISPNMSVSLASSSIWSSLPTEVTDTDNAKPIMAQCLVEMKDALEDESRTAESKASIFDAMAQLERLNPKVYGELKSDKSLCDKTFTNCHKYSFNVKASHSTLEAWKSIANEASCNDCRINLNTAIDEIERTFVEDESLSKFECYIRRDMQLPSVYNSSKSCIRNAQTNGAPQGKGKFTFLFGWMKKFSKNKGNH